MIKYPSVQGTVGKRARVRVKPQEIEQKKKSGFLVRLFGQKYRRRPELNLFELFTMAISLQMPLEYCAVAYELSVRWGALLYLMGHTLFLLISSMPLFVINLFLGMYTKRGYIRIWDMAPIFRGIGFSVALFQMSQEFVHVSMAALALIFFTTALTRGAYWGDCKFERATNTCVPLSSEKTFKDDCCDYVDRYSRECRKNVVHYSTYDFLRENIMRDNEDMSLLESIKHMNWQWIIYVGVSWLIVFIFMVMGFNRFKKVTNVLVMIVIFCFCAPTFTLNILASEYFVTPTMLSVNLNDLFNMQYWVAMIKAAVIHQTPGCFITLGAFASNNVKPESATGVIFAMKVFISSMVISYLSVVIIIQKHFYKADGKYCFLLNGNEVTLAFTYDVFARLPGAPLLIIMWSCIVFIFGLMSPIFSMTCLVDSLADAYPNTKHYRVCLCALLCLFALAVNCLLLNPLFYVIIYTWIYNGQFIVFIAVVVMYFVAIFLYSVKNIAIDYYFMYGTPLRRLWIVAYKFACVCTLASLVVILYDSEKCAFIKANYEVTVLNYIVAGTIIAPIPIYMIYLYGKSHISRSTAIDSATIYECLTTVGHTMCTLNFVQIKMAKWQFATIFTGVYVPHFHCGKLLKFKTSQEVELLEKVKRCAK